MIISPSIAFSVIEDPEDSQGGDADQQNGGEGDDEGILAPLAGTSLVVVGLIGASALAATITKIIKYMKVSLKLTW